MVVCLAGWLTPLQVQMVLPSLCFASDQQLPEIGLRSAGARLELSCSRLSSACCGNFELDSVWLGVARLRKRGQRWHLPSASIATKTSWFSDAILLKHCVQIFSFLTNFEFRVILGLNKVRLGRDRCNFVPRGGWY